MPRNTELQRLTELNSELVLTRRRLDSLHLERVKLEYSMEVHAVAADEYSDRALTLRRLDSLHERLELMHRLYHVDEVYAAARVQFSLETPLRRARIVIWSIPPGAEVFMFPRYFVDFRPELLTQLSSRSPFYRGIVADTGGLNIQEHETSYVLLGRNCNETIRRTVYLTADSVQTEQLRFSRCRLRE